jgi:hypothetical protein
MVEACLLDPRAIAPEAVRKHVTECAACRRYLDGLHLIRTGFPEEELYSASLKARTLARLSDVTALEERGMSILLLLAAAAGAALLTATPIAVGAWALGYFIESVVWSLGISAVLFSSTAAVTLAVGALPLLQIVRPTNLKGGALGFKEVHHV